MEAKQEAGPEEIIAALSAMEASSFPKLGFPSQKKTEVINGKKVDAISKWNRGHSGKGYTTLFYVDGVRVSRSKIIAALTKAGAA